MVIIATQIRVGMVLNINEELYRVTWTMHRTPGKGNACIQTKLKSIITGKNLEQRFMSNEKVEKADLETREMQYLYSQPDGLVMMDNESFEQIVLTDEIIGEGKDYLIEGDSYPITVYEENPVGIDLPKTINLKVESAPPDIRKATATNSLKPVTLENGMVINAPGFIKQGDLIKVNTETNEYLERVKE